MDPIFFESLLIKLLFTNTQAQDKILPYLDARVFSSENKKKLVKDITKFFEIYEKFPNASEMQLFSSGDVFSEIKSALDMNTSEYSDEFIMDEVEGFFSDKLYFNALIDGKKALDEGDQLKMAKAYSDMQEALAFSFDNNMGLSFTEDWERMYNIHHDSNYFISTGLETLDKMMGGGFPSRAITLFSAGTNVGKTALQCGLASNVLLQNKNVLYITLEEQEDILSKRFQGNLFDMEIDSIKFLSKEKFKEIYDRTIKKLKTNLKIIGWTSGNKNANHIRLLVKELKLKHKFVPDIIFVDYMGCMIPIRLGKNYDSNAELMNVTDEIRSIGVELGIPIVSGLQLNRGGLDSSDVNLSDTASSIGSTFKADFIFGVTQPPELASEGLYAVKALKSRSSDKTKLTKAFIGIEFAKMRVFDVNRNGNNNDDKLEKVVESNVVINKVTRDNRTAKRNKIFDEA